MVGEISTVTRTEVLRAIRNRYSRRHLRTLQRRVRQWRIVVEKQLVYASAEQSEVNEANQGGIGPVSDN